jgi:hypothetical protein
MGCIVPVIAAACGLWLFGIPGMVVALIGGSIAGWFLALIEDGQKGGSNG